MGGAAQPGSSAAGAASPAGVAPGTDEGNASAGNGTMNLPNPTGGATLPGSSAGDAAAPTGVAAGREEGNASAESATTDLLNPVGGAAVPGDSSAGTLGLAGVLLGAWGPGLLGGWGAGEQKEGDASAVSGPTDSNSHALNDSGSSGACSMRAASSGANGAPASERRRRSPYKPACILQPRWAIMLSVAHAHALAQRSFPGCRHSGYHIHSTVWGLHHWRTGGF